MNKIEDKYKIFKILSSLYILTYTEWSLKYLFKIETKSNIIEMGAYKLQFFDIVQKHSTMFSSTFNRALITISQFSVNSCQNNFYLLVEKCLEIKFLILIGLT